MRTAEEIIEYAKEKNAELIKPEKESDHDKMIRLAKSVAYLDVLAFAHGKGK